MNDTTHIHIIDELKTECDRRVIRTSEQPLMAVDLIML